MKKLKGVCIGAGYFSQFHYEAWNRLDGVEILAVCDTNIEKATAVAKNFNIASYYNDVETMFQEQKPDFVDIITPPETHLDLCKLAIQYKIHIICQKPLAPTLSESKAIASTIENSEIRMMVHENFRFMPWYREIRKLLDKNIIGNQIHTFNLRMRMGDGWQPDAYMNRQPYFREMKKLLMFETGIHFIDVFRYLGGEISQVYARLKRLNNNIKGEDFGWVQFDFKNGGLGFIDANRYNESTAENARLTFGNVLLEGNKGSLRLYEDGRITVQLLGEKEKEHVYNFQKINFAGDCVYATQQHFINALNTNKPFETNVSAYLKNLEVLEKVYDSNEKGLPIKIS